MRTIEGKLGRHSYQCDAIWHEDPAGFVTHIPGDVTYEGTMFLTKPKRLKKWPSGPVNVRVQVDNEVFVFKRAVLTRMKTMLYRAKGHKINVGMEVDFVGPAY